MALSKEMRLLANKWERNTGWPKRLEWIEIHKIRGWTGQRLDFNFPFMAIVGENGAGKSTILQAVASVYRPRDQDQRPRFASDFFPDTAWERLEGAEIVYSVREGNKSTKDSIRKPTDRWRGNPERKERPLIYIDLRRSQPLAAQVGYSRIAKPQFKVMQSKPFTEEKLSRFSAIIGRPYRKVGYDLTDGDENRTVPVMDAGAVQYSGFHQGAGELTLADFVKLDLPEHAVVLIDELETSLHPRSQRRLVRDLAEQCRLKDLQILVTTHSPAVLEELPPSGRAYVMKTATGRALVTGVSPFFAMTLMDEEQHPEVELYVEDDRSRILLQEILFFHGKELSQRCRIIPYGAASVGQQLGQMVKYGRFPRPSLVFLDADQAECEGCIILPGDDAPERVVFGDLKQANWAGVSGRIGRTHPELVEATDKAMTVDDHHEWLKQAGEPLQIGGDILWQAMSSEWARRLDKAKAQALIEQINAVLEGVPIHRESRQQLPPVESSDKPEPKPRPMIRRTTHVDEGPTLFD